MFTVVHSNQINLYLKGRFSKSNLGKCPFVMVKKIKNGGEKMEEYRYIADTTDFYRDFNETIATVNKKIGVSRRSLSRIPINKASVENTEKTIAYLEEKSRADYESSIQQCKQDILGILRKSDEAWEVYQQKERILENYRQNYNFDRKNELPKKILKGDILTCLSNGLKKDTS